MGIVSLLPVVISFLIVIWVIELLTAPFMSITENLLTHVHFLEKEPRLIIFISRILVVACLFISTLVVGWLTNKYLFSFLLQKMHVFFSKIPGFGGLYKFSKDLTKAILSTESPPFQGTVLISFPNKESLALGLLIDHIPPSIKKADKGIDVAVFVPTAPHPISGFILMTAKNYVCPVDMTTEEVFKFIISCGVVPPARTETPLSSTKHV